ncbi:MAG: hypothetical protein R3B72_16140 [Polyangiaceae bacterium]
MELGKRRRDDGKIEILAVGVGLWREGPPKGSLVTPGMAFGRLEVLGVLHPLEVPAGVRGVVTDEGRKKGPGIARRPVGHGEVLAVVDPERALGAGAGDAAAAVEEATGLSFGAPTSGRYYGRPAPDKPPFVEVGQVIAIGDPVGVLEIMKTFNRIAYGDDHGRLPSPAKVVRVFPKDGEDLEAGDPIVEVEPA